MDAKTLLQRCFGLIEKEVGALEQLREQAGSLGPLQAEALVEFSKLLTSAASKDLNIDDDSFSSMSVDQLQALIDEQIEKRLASRSRPKTKSAARNKARAKK